MIRLMLQCVAIFVVGIAATWLALCHWLGRPYLGAAGLIMILGGHSLVLGVELILMSRSQRVAGVNAAVVGDLLSAWLAETWCALRAFLWRQPFRSGAFADSLDPAEGRRGLLLIHGFLCNRGVWNGWYPRLLKSGTPYIGLSLEPAFGSIDRYVVQIDEAIERLIQTTGLPPVVVAHSMGGLAVRAWLRDGSYSGLQKIYRVVTLGSPHRGTALVKLNLSTNIEQMAPGSEWLRNLAQDEHSSLAGQFTCVFSRCDNVVFPVGTACLEGAESIEIPRCAHIQMVDHPISFALVHSLLTITQPDASIAAKPQG